ncbi:MAG: methyltransferase domain-containing protein [Planctomycetes bacterium]|nr:methyltransferase domain-containing protein [Planctomycetota bacterium]MCB9906043.1 methyltransferase domain-containing protein [Planctomycetota bacterium]
MAPTSSDRPSLTPANCLACGSLESHQLGYWNSMPLSVMSLPRTKGEAVASPTYKLDVRRCTHCGHVFHTSFDQDEVHYRENSNLVFNQGHGWQLYQDDLAERWVAQFSLAGKRVIEVGAGDGQFLERMARQGCEVIAFEPGPDADACAARGFKVQRAYFGEEEVGEHQPDAIVCRHVIEHMADPSAFLRAIRRGAVATNQAPIFLAEVPRIDKALDQHRINDFLYEHVSHFTEHSFRVLFEEAGWGVIDVDRGYGDEVVTLAAQPRLRRRRREETPRLALSLVDDSREFRESVDLQTDELRNRIATWQEEGRTVALWGGTGKGAALINMCGLSEDVAPLVIDSDPRKQGAHVPGTGQLIQSPAACLEHGVDVILICTQWRARDIEHEIKSVLNLDAELYVVHRGQIVPLTPELEL